MPDKPNVMDKFFAPKSVAAIGASATPGKPGNVLLKNIRDNGFKGALYLVNPRGGRIEGLAVCTSIDELPHGIDQAIVTLPAAAAPATVRALGARGMHVTLAARRLDRLEAVLESVCAAGGSGEAIALDVTDEDAWRDAVAAVESAFGKLDIVGRFVPEAGQ